VSKPKPTDSAETQAGFLPGPPCITAEGDQQDRLSNIETAVYEIRSALVGNPKLGHKGIVHRLDAVEVKAEASDRKLLVWGGIAAAAGTALSFAKDKLLGP